MGDCEVYILYLVQFWWRQRLLKKKRFKSVMHINDEVDQEVLAYKSKWRFKTSEHN